MAYQIGKLPQQQLAELLEETAPDNPNVLVPPRIGEDTTVIRFPYETLAVSRPIISTDHSISPDLEKVAAQLDPAYALSTILFPPTMTPAGVERIFYGLYERCLDSKVEIVGGHTEITHGVSTPIVVTYLFGNPTNQATNFSRTDFNPDNLLIAATDPITFTTDEMEWYVVNVNVNDIATSGVPRWFHSTTLWPGKDRAHLDDRASEIFGNLDSACAFLELDFLGHYPESVQGLDRSIAVGAAFGEAEPEKLVTTAGARVGDKIIMTKGAPIEGTAIIAKERYDELRRRGHDDEFLQSAYDFLQFPGISILLDALLAANHEVHSMHDPTEGGLARGIYEMMLASGTGALIDPKAVHIPNEAELLCREFGLDPWGTITSGTLLVAADSENAQNILRLYEQQGIKAAIIGEAMEPSYGLRVRQGDNTVPLKHSEIDEITKLL